MKKVIRLAAIATVAMALTVACKSKVEEPAVDTTAVEAAVIDTIDSIAEAAQEPVKEVSQTAKPAAKPAAKKVEEKKEEMKAATEATVNTPSKIENKKNMLSKSTEEPKLEAATTENAPKNAVPSKKKNMKNMMAQ